MSPDISQKVSVMQLQQEERHTKELAARLGIPYVFLINYQVSNEVLKVLPRELVINYGVVPYLRVAKQLKVASWQPPTPGLEKFLDDLARTSGYQVQIAFCSRSSFSWMLTYYGKLRQQEAAQKAAEVKKKAEDFANTIKTLENIRGALTRVSTTQLLELLFAGAVNTDASDIHLEPSGTTCRFRLRIDGVLEDVATLSVEQYKALRSRIKLMAHLKLDVLNKPQDGRFEINVGERSIDVRVSTLPSPYGEDIVMRLLTAEGKFLSLEELGFSSEMLKLVNDAITKPHGMILTTGPTGSGKTTTLYAVLSRLNRPQIKIITIEDPIEYRLPGVDQTQVSAEAGYTFATALRSVLRQDPDVIMIGEIRDPETAKIALEAALTGHLVLATLHTNDAPSAIPRLMEMGIEPYLLAGSINLVVAQRLVRRLCGNACPPGRKFKGRIPIVEAFAPSKEFNDLVSRKATIEEFRDKAHNLGMHTMLDDGMLKVKEGVTTKEEIDRVTRE